ncbi:MAG TPA: MFS transporter [Ruminiclostridium sp.]|nr:MFS transporter [Ruminiclostridium sp.]
MQQSQESNKLTRWPYLFTGVISMLFAGIIYAWSILKAPLASEFGWSPSQLALNFTLTMCFFCIGGIVSGILTKKTSPRITVTISTVLVCVGFTIASQMSGNSILTLYISYGIMCGLGIGMAYNAIISSTNAWFPDKKGTCSGAMMMGFGASTLVLGNFAGALIRAESIGWRTTYLILGIAIGIVLLMASFIVKFPPQGQTLPQPKASDKTKEKESFETRDYTTAEMLRRLTFWKFFLFSITMAAVGSTVISFAKDLALSIGAADTLATTLVGVLSIFNGLGRIFSGVLFDMKGCRFTMVTANIISIAAPVVILTAVLAGSLPIGIIGLCLVGISYGCSPTISSAFTSLFYGSKNFPMNFSVTNTILIPASFTATLAGSMVASTGSYVIPFIMLIAFAVVSLLLNLSIKRP